MLSNILRLRPVWNMWTWAALVLLSINVLTGIYGDLNPALMLWMSGLILFNLFVIADWKLSPRKTEN